MPTQGAEIYGPPPCVLNEADSPDGKTLLDYFEHWADRTPSKIAAVNETRESLT